MNELLKVVNVYDEFKTNPSFTSRKNIRKAEYDGWLALAQNTETGSTFAKMNELVEVVHFIKEGDYYGFKLNNTIYLNGRFVVKFTDYVDSLASYHRMVGSIFLKKDFNTININGVKVEYVSYKGEEAAFVRWAGTRYHSGISYNLLV